MAEQQVDILIVGGGLTGAALMLALEDQGLQTMMVEAESFENRMSALGQKLRTSRPAIAMSALPPNAGQVGTVI